MHVCLGERELLGHLPSVMGGVLGKSRQHGNLVTADAHLQLPAFFLKHVRFCPHPPKSYPNRGPAAVWICFRWVLL